MDFYETQGITPDASMEDIRSAYRKLARKSHPDVTGNSDCGHFREVRQAYETLSDPQSRTVYDRTLSTSVPVRIVRGNVNRTLVEPLIPNRRVVEPLHQFYRSVSVEQNPFGEFFSALEQFFRRL